ncbi:Aminotransferase-like, plant mobile domain [Sesbania bispinosa]|nr:Aminotransferase-like, plant mobile domain [Sesbania bispinosa]
MAKDLKATTIDSAKHCREFLARCCATPIPPADSSTKTPQKKVRGTGNVLPPEQRKSPRESLKYTFATWVRYFYGDYDAEGTRLPLASLYLGSLYGRLDQIQDQMFSSFGRFPINSFVDLIFLQYFLYERFPEYAPVRTVPEPVPEGVSRPLEPRVWGWTIGHPRQMLSELLDEEDRFVHRPYTKNLFPGVEQLHDLYHQAAFSSRNLRASRVEGMFNTWDLILRPQYLPGFLVTDNVSAAGGAFWPYAYCPDCVCRQFGLDQAPCDINLEFKDFAEVMKAALFLSPDALPSLDPDKFIPSDRVGRVLDVWVSYHARLRSSVKRYEGQDSLQVFPNIPIIKKVCRKQKSPTPDTSSTPTPPKKGAQTRSPKAKRGPVVATRASERLKPKKVMTPNSPSHPIIISDVDSLQWVCAQVEGESPPPSSSARATTQGSSAEKDI